MPGAAAAELQPQARPGRPARPSAGRIAPGRAAAQRPENLGRRSAPRRPPEAAAGPVRLPAGWPAPSAMHRDAPAALHRPRPEAAWVACPVAPEAVRRRPEVSSPKEQAQVWRPRAVCPELALRRRREEVRLAGVHREPALAASARRAVRSARHWAAHQEWRSELGLAPGSAVHASGQRRASLPGARGPLPAEALEWDGWARPQGARAGSGAPVLLPVEVSATAAQVRQRAAPEVSDVRAQPPAAGSEPAVPGRLPAEWGGPVRAPAGQAARPEVPAASDGPVRRQVVEPAVSAGRGPRAEAARGAAPRLEAVPDAVPRRAAPDAPARPAWGVPSAFRPVRVLPSAPARPQAARFVRAMLWRPTA